MSLSEQLVNGDDGSRAQPRAGGDVGRGRASSDLRRRQGDAAESAALASAFEAHHQRVFRAAYRVTGSVEDAQDVLQTVFLNAVRRAKDGAVDLGLDPKRYLSRAAVNAAVDLLRSRRRVANTGEPIPEIAGGPEADEGWRRRELRERLRSAMSGLAPRAAQIVALRYFEGFGNAEIAAMLDTSAASIAVTLHRARQRLKQELQELAV